MASTPTQNAAQPSSNAAKLDAVELYSMERIGLQLLEHDRLKEAEQLFSGLTVLHPSSWYSYYALGLIARKRGQHQGSLAYFKHAQSLAAQVTFEPTLAMAREHIRLGQKAEARAALSLVIQRTDAEEMIHQTARALLRALAQP